MNSNLSKSTAKSNSVSSVLVVVFTLILLIIDISVGTWAVVNYANGLNVSDSGSPIGVSCVAQPSNGSRYAAHLVNGGSFIEPNHLLVIIQTVLLLVVIGLTLSLIKYRGWKYRAVVTGSLIVVLIMEVVSWSTKTIQPNKTSFPV